MEAPADELIQWATIPSWPAYEVSTDGRVRRDGRELKLRRGTHGYEYYQPVRGRTVLIHRAMCEAFLGPPPPGAVVRHLDGSKINHIRNLTWGTSAENAEDMIRMGRSLYGRRNHKARLTDAKVRMMRQLWQQGITVTSISRRFNVSYTTAAYAVKRRTWRHVT